MTDSTAMLATVLKAVLSRLLATGKTVVTESDVVQIVRPIMIGDNTLIAVAGAEAEADMHALAWRCAQLAAATPGLAVELSVQGPGQFTLRIEHEPAERWLRGLTQITEAAASPSQRVIDHVWEPKFFDKHETLGRNDPCWCGSGRKYKKCHAA